MNAIAHAFFKLAPNVVVYNQILKLAKSIIPNVMKNNDTSLDNTTLDNNPIRIVITHNIFPKSEECSDFEYSLCFENKISNDSLSVVRLILFFCSFEQSKHVLEGLVANWFNSFEEIEEINDSE